MDNQPDDTIITIRDFIEIVYSHRILIFLMAFVGFIIGIIICCSIPKEYSSTVKVIPVLEGSSPKNNSFYNILNRIDLSQKRTGNDGIDAYLYSDVVESNNFLLPLLNLMVHPGNNNQSIRLQEYITKDIKSPWWKKIPGLPMRILGIVRGAIFADKNNHDTSNTSEINNNEDSFNITELQDGLISTLRSRIKTKLDDSKNLLTITVTMQNPQVAAEIADAVVMGLESYLTKYKTDKLEKELDFAEGLKNQAKSQYYESQDKYASFIDSNTSISSHSKQIEADRLQSELNRDYNIYNEVSLMAQNNLIRLEKHRPIFLYIEPSTISRESVKPNYGRIILTYTLLGVAIPLIWYLSIKPLIIKRFKGFSPIDNRFNNGK